MSGKLNIVSYDLKDNYLTCEVAYDSYLNTVLYKRMEDLRKDNPNLVFKGFRKGYEPLDIFVIAVGMELFYYPIVFNILDCIRQKQALLVFDVEEIDIDYKEKECLIGKFKVCPYPEMELGDKYKNIKLEKISEDISEEEFKEELNRLLLNKRSVKDEKEIVENGDYVTFVCRKNDDEIKLEINGEYSVVVGNEQWPENFESALIGHRVNEDLIIPTEFPVDFVTPEVAGKKITLAVKIKEVRNVVMPELDDFFAKLHGYPNLEGFYDGVKERLRRDKIESNKEKYFDEIEKQLLGAYDVGDSLKVPDDYVERKIADKLKGYESMFQQDKKSFQQWKKDNPKDYEELVGEKTRNIIIQGTKIHMILEKIANIEGIYISDEELKEAISKWPYASETAESMVTFLRRRKVVDKILEYAKWE